MSSDQQQQHPMETLLGHTLLTKANSPNKQTTTALKGKDLVLLYFSASWCPPCKAFTPLLVDFYNNNAKDGKIEIVFVSSDNSVQAFHEYYDKMPWLAIPVDPGSAQIKSNLARLLQIRGIPTLVVLDAKTGNFVTSEAKNEVATVREGRDLIASWKQKESVPIEQAVVPATPSFARGLFTSLLKTFARNPTYIFGLLYFYSIAIRYLKEHGYIAKSAGTEEEL